MSSSRDAVDRQLADLSHQGRGLARLAHFAALLLVVLFSLGSLVALSGDALQAVVVGWQHGAVEVPQAISIAVSTLLVVCCDLGMIYAAMMLRILGARRAPASEKLVHAVVMAVVAILEAGTYGWMGVQYDAPVSLMAWALIIARAASAPLLSVYLSMARPLAVQARDVLHHVELNAGAAVLRSVVEIARDEDASLEKKVAIWRASAVAPEADQRRLEALIAVAQDDGESDDDDVQPSYPTGGGSPIVTGIEMAASAAPREVMDRPHVLPLAGTAQRTAGRGYTSTRAKGGIPAGTSVEHAARRAYRKGMSVSQLETAAGISHNAASKWLKVLKAEGADDVGAMAR